MKTFDYEDSGHRERALKVSSNNRMDIKSFFSTAKKRLYLANLVVEDYRDEVEANLEAQQRDMRL